MGAVAIATDTPFNENGQATGTTTLQGSPGSQAFFWDGSTMLGIDTIPTGGSSFGFDINNSGQIVGMDNSRAFRWDAANGMTLLDPGRFGSANGITQAGGVVGERSNFGSNTSMYWNRDGLPSELHPGTNSRATAINNNLEVIGTNSAGGYFSASPESAQLSIPIDTPTDLNLSRQIVGSVSGIASLYDFNSNSLTTIGKLDSSDLFSIALGINSHGTAVGTSGGTRAFIYDSTLGLQDATSLLRDDYFGWTILALEDINDKGQMIGVGRYNGVDHAVILSTVAVPEPSPFCMMAMVLTYCFAILHLSARFLRGENGTF